MRLQLEASPGEQPVGKVKCRSAVKPGIPNLPLNYLMVGDEPGLDAALPAELTPQALPFGFTFTDFSQLNMFPRARRDHWGGTWKLKSFVNPGKTLKFRRAKPGW